MSRGPVPRPGSIRRLELEQAIARGDANSLVMRRYGLSYAGLREFIAGMDGPSAIPADTPAEVSPRTLQPHGTHAAYNRHLYRRQTPCGACSESERVYNTARVRTMRQNRRTP